MIMRRVLSIILILCLNLSFGTQSAFADYDKDIIKKNTEEESVVTQEDVETEDPVLPNIFIWQLPDEEIGEETTVDDYYGYDDVAESSEEVQSPLKGYLDYVEGSDAIMLKKDNKQLVLNLRVPQELKTEKVNSINASLPQTMFSKAIYSRSDNLMYNIAPLDTFAELKQGPFAIGTTYNESIDYSDLGFTTSFYTKYENKYFSLSASYDKSAGVSYSEVIDKFSFTPELKLTKHISIRDVMTSDVTRNRKKNEIILSIKPMQDDRVRFEFGAGQTYDENSVLLRSQIKFSTQYKW